MEGPYSARFYWIQAGGLRMGRPFVHRPVLVDEVVDLLEPASGGVVIDATLGGGGHAGALLDRLGPDTSLLGIDRDLVAIEAAGERLHDFGERAKLVQADFRDLARVLAEVREAIPDSTWAAPVMGVLFDLGVSSPQLDVADRGLSYQKDGPLDMRMNRAAGRTAADVVNDYPEDALRRVISRYGEERFATRIARAIMQRRSVKRFESTLDLASVVRDAIPASARRTGRHPARRTFQALRIEVNDELDALREALTAALEIVDTGGRLVVITYHSLEDRIVKQFFRSNAARPIPRGMPVTGDPTDGLLRDVTPKPIRPSAREVEANPRSASARLRAAQRTEVAA